MRWISTLLLCSLLSISVARGEEIVLQIGKQVVSATIANTARSRAHGLMHTTYLCDNCGMLFVFPRAAKYTFWMKNTPIPLSIAFIDINGSILNIEEMDANSLLDHSPQGLALYALEMKKNWFAAHGIQAENRVEGLLRAPPGR